MKNKRIKEFNDKAGWLRNGVLYHRGKYDSNIKENTVEAINGAIEDNLGVELDVRLSKDQKVVVSHDDDLKRVFGIDKRISECSYEEIKVLTQGKLPLLEEILKIVNDKVGLMIEIKSNKVGVLEEAVYKILKEYKGRYVIVSFNPMSLNYFRKKDSSIIRGQLSYSYRDSKYNFIIKFILRRMLFNFFVKPHFISYGIDGCDYKLLAKYRKKGYFIIGWPYDSEKNKEKLSKVYDNMIIDGLRIKEF